ncbi:class III lanthipeptide [Streptomyces abyssomicinicus]|nr:class III lanthipeptide [Streptomyces abyssomicinicus]
MSILQLQKLEPVNTPSNAAILSITSSGSRCCTKNPW